MNIRFSSLLATGARTLTPTLLVASAYLLVVGHDIPGGGFAGGLLGAAGLLLVYLAYGDRGVRRTLPMEPEIVTGVGLTIAVAAGSIGLVGGGSFLEGTALTAEIPLVGTVKLSSVLAFDAGVYLLVLGLIATAIVRLGGEMRS